MQIKKELVLFFMLVLISISLLLATDISTAESACVPNKNEPATCCNKLPENKVESPWNFITQGILHLSV